MHYEESSRAIGLISSPRPHPQTVTEHNIYIGIFQYNSKRICCGGRPAQVRKYISRVFSPLGLGNLLTPTISFL